ncbi:MAG: PD-(D/E)XK nuclease family protein, partial [Proteobacteria bacterium]|nr:PD-(D/E)XK nuclease family protein [Pseudomonadota bacterium]
EYIEQKKELYAAAAWARKQLEQNPSASIGIVSLNLNSIREDIDHGFRSGFMPDTGNISTYTNQNLYSISIGQPLSVYPLVQTAINLLMLGTRSVDINTYDKLLHSPFIKGANEEYSKRAQFYYLLRQFGEQKIGFKALYWIHSERCHEFARCDEFIELLKSFELSVLSHAKQHTLNEWVVIFSEWLKLFGWPGERSLTSDEQQTVNAWQAALSQLGSLSSVVSGPVNFQTAIYQLNRILSDSRFQPETEETPVQILGLTGAAGMQFDCLWVLGMQDDAWPEKKITNPFIPRSCLKDYNVPGSSAELQYEKARKMTQQLIESSKYVVFSYTRQESDKECRPSPLIKSIDRDKNNYLDIYPKFISTIFSSARIEKFIDLENPAASVAKEVKGGSLLFKDQAACPFKAFARHRLHAQSLQNIDIGLNAMERGNLAHRSLQYLWQRLKDSENLHYKSDAEIQSLIVSVIDDAIKQQALYQPETFTDRFTELEKKRLQRLLSDWLSIERQRDQFKVVATEKKQEIKFSGINLQLRVDRIDELDNGRFVIIDYKTGQISVRDWDSENPKDPQLPLYAVTSEQKIVALAFASLKRGKLGYVGYSEEENLLPAIKTNNSIEWNQQIKIWRNVLTKLAENFCKGDINVDPTVTACRYCDLHSLCRVYDRIENPDDINREDTQDA